MDIVDPPPVPETHLRPSDLKNRVLLLRPCRHDVVEGRDGKPWEFVECCVWVLDRAGVVEYAENVRLSWRKAVAQLRLVMGQLVACRPVEQEDRSIELVPLKGEARAVAERVAAGIIADEGPPTEGIATESIVAAKNTVEDTEWGYGGEPYPEPF
jgi:hypothetical protein